MTDIIVQGLCQIFKNSTCSYLAVTQVIHAKPLKVTHLEVAVQFLARKLLCKHPVIQFTQAIAWTE